MSASVRTAPFSFTPADRLSVEIFDEIARYANEDHNMQAVRVMLQGFYPMSIARGVETEGSLKLRQTRHLNAIVIDTEHSQEARHRIADQINQLRQRRGSHFGPVSLTFFNFDFNSGEILAYLRLPKRELMHVCVSFDMFCTRYEPGIECGTRLDALYHLDNPDTRSHLLNGPARMLVNETPELRRVRINLGHPKVYVDGAVNTDATAGLLLPNAPKLRHLEATGGIGPRLFNVTRYILLEYLAFDVVMDFELLLAVSKHCVHISHLQISLCERYGPPNRTPFHFPALLTLVVTSTRVLKLLATEEVSPILSTLLVADNRLRTDALGIVMARPSISAVGPASSTRAGCVARGVIGCLRASNNARGKSNVRLVLQDLELNPLCTFLETWFDENRWPQVHRIDIEHCRLTASIALQIAALARMIVIQGGEVAFKQCSAVSTEDSNTTPVRPSSHDSWREAMHKEGGMIVRGQVAISFV